MDGQTHAQFEPALRRDLKRLDKKHIDEAPLEEVINLIIENTPEATETLRRRHDMHGFLVLSDTAVFAYKCDEVYHPDDEGKLMWNDPAIGIEWPEIDTPLILSDKDKIKPSLAELRRRA